VPEPQQAPWDVSWQLVPLRPDGGAASILPCDCISEVVFTPGQVNCGQGIATGCAGCQGTWMLLVLTGALLEVIGSETQLPAGHVGVLVLEGIL
jgi:hypothetical protein